MCAFSQTWIWNKSKTQFLARQFACFFSGTSLLDIFLTTSGSRGSLALSAAWKAKRGQITPLPQL
eukprot:UN26751